MTLAAPRSLTPIVLVSEVSPVLDRSRSTCAAPSATRTPPAPPAPTAGSSSARSTFSGRKSQPTVPTHLPARRRCRPARHPGRSLPRRRRRLPRRRRRLLPQKRHAPCAPTPTCDLLGRPWCAVSHCHDQLDSSGSCTWGVSCATVTPSPSPTPPPPPSPSPSPPPSLSPSLSPSPPPPRSAAPAPPGSHVIRWGFECDVPAGGFCGVASLTIRAGETVTWVASGHNVLSGAPLPPLPAERARWTETLHTRGCGQLPPRAPAIRAPAHAARSPPPCPGANRTHDNLFSSAWHPATSPLSRSGSSVFLNPPPSIGSSTRRASRTPSPRRGTSPTSVGRTHA